MKKDEELVSLCPQPRPSDVIGVSVTADKAKASGKYICGDVLTVALWDGKETPNAVWYFCGEYWSGRRSDGENDRKSLRIENVCHDNDFRMISVSKRDDRVIRDYFSDFANANIKDVIKDGQWVGTDRLKKKRENRKEESLEKIISIEPKEPKDFEKRIRLANTDLMYLWVKNESEQAISAGGVSVKLKFQTCRCDVCGHQFMNAGTAYKHKQDVVCPNCSSRLTVHLERYGSKSKYAYRKFILGQKSKAGYWLREYGVSFTYKNKRCELGIEKREVYLLGPNVHYGFNYSWPCGAVYPVLRSSFAPERIFYGSMYSAEVVVDRNLVRSLDAFMNSDFNIPYMDVHNKNYSLTSKLLMWRRTRNIPMAESLVKTGWGESLFKTFECQNGKVQKLLNLRSKTYYGVFGLNRAELNAIERKDFDYVADVKKWKEIGLPITKENMNQIRNIATDATLRDICKKYGMRPTLKYLRQVSRRAGTTDGSVDRSIVFDWEDYLRMSEKLGIDLSQEINRYPLQLARRHNEVVSILREKELAGSMERRKKAAEALDKRFSVSKVMKRIRSLYEYADNEYCIVVPKDVFDIDRDSVFLGHCVANTNRYYERISAEESYIVFLRHAEKPESPWYTLEIEPGGTIRQKRSYSNEQYADLQDAIPFLKKWQSVVQKRMDENERKLAKQSKGLRNKEFDELTINSNVIRTGRSAGKLLVEELMKDLMEAATA